ncbi:MAG: TonB-dependent receptor [Proteobacteria bacterium]|nr:TonB-dependent receptor [Pseudomonadota bacterium]
MTRVLFVCLGNICRSPSAEGVFRKLVEDTGLSHSIEIDSAGTGSWHVGKAPDRRAQAAARQRGIDITRLRARQIVPQDFAAFDYLIAMDQQNLGDLNQYRPRSGQPVIRLLLDFGETMTAFASLSKGYKAGGFNLGDVPQDVRNFAAEELWTIEAGLRATLLRNTLHLNASVFHHWRVDQQVRTSFQLDPGDPTSFGFATINVDEGKTFGVEAGLRWFPEDQWEFYADVGLLDATFGNIPPPLDYLSGRNQAHAPGYTFAAGMVYRHPNGMFARLDATAKGAFYFDVSHDQKSTAYELVNARVGYAGDQWLLSVWARNIFDRNYAVRGFYFGNQPPDFPNTLYTRLGDPRQIGVTIEKRF